MECRRGLIQAVGGRGDALHLFNGGGNGFGCRLQMLHIVAKYLNGHAGACHHAHHAVHDVGGGNGTFHIGAQVVDLLSHLVARDVVGHGDVDGGAVTAAAEHGGCAAAVQRSAHGGDFFNGLNAAGHLVNKVFCIFSGAILRKFHGDVDGVHIHLRHKGEATAQDSGGRGKQQHKGCQQDNSLMVQRPGDGLAVGGQDLVQQPCLLLGDTPQHTAAHGGHHSQGHQQAGHEGVGHGEGKVGKEVLRKALHKHDGQKDAHGGEGGGDHSARHLLGAGHGGLNDRCALVAETVDILDDHHRVIHQHTYRHRQARQGDHVDGHAGEIHQHNGENHAGGDGDKGNEGGSPVTEEEKQHQHGEQRAPQQGGENGLHNEVDIVALIHEGMEVEAVIFLAELGETAGDVVADLGGSVGGLLGKGGDDTIDAV